MHEQISTFNGQPTWKSLSMWFRVWMVKRVLNPGCVKLWLYAECMQVMNRPDMPWQTQSYEIPLRFCLQLIFCFESGFLATLLTVA